MSKSEGGQFFDPFREPRKEQAPQVKDSWLKGVADGYALWPERINPGVSILATEAVLNDPPENWNEFLTSILSDKQVNKLEAQLNKHHKRGDLPYDSDRGIASLNSMAERVTDREIPPADSYHSIQLLWMDTTDIVATTILDVLHVSRDDPNSDELERDFFPKTRSRETIFADPNVVANLDIVKPILAAAKKGLLSPDGLELSELSKLGGSKSLKDGDQRHKNLLDKYTHIYEVLNPHEEAERFFDILRKGVQDLGRPLTAEEIFAEETGWYFREICAQLADSEIERSIANENLPQKYSSWISY